MRIKPKEVFVPETEPFKHDRLSRFPIAENLTTLVNNTSEPLVLAVSGKYGSGKTTFLKMWAQHLRNCGHQVAYLSAWENDFQKETFPVLVSEISGLFPKSSKAAKSILSAGIRVLKNALPALVRIATSGLVDPKALGSEEYATLSESIAKDELQRYSSSKSEILKFREELSMYARSESGNARVIVILDELDRCRPNYAVEYLEIVKHLFSVDNVVFVLGIDIEQILSSIRKIYGVGIDARGYLLRFIDLNVELPSPSTAAYIDSMITSLDVDSFFENRKKYNEFQGERGSIVSVLQKLAVVLELSIRDVEKVITRFSVVLKMLQENSYLYPDFLLFMLVLKVHRTEEYEKIRAHRLKIDGVIDWLATLPSGDVFLYDLENGVGRGFIPELLRSLNQSSDKIDGIDYFQGIISRTEEPEFRKKWATDVIQLSKYERYMNRMSKTLEYVTKKVDLVEKLLT